MNLVDIHCHLNHEEFKDLDSVLERAKKAGVKAIIVSGTNPLSNKEALELSQKDEIIKVSFGIHPIDALGLFEDATGISKPEGPFDVEAELKFIEENQDKIVAIGEVGLDFHWDKDHHQEQKEIFQKIIRLAIKIKEPLVIHSWDAEEECLDILEAEIKRKEVQGAGNEGMKIENEIPVILHCFGGRKSLVTRAMELGYYFSIPPSTIKSGNFNPIIKKVDLKQLLTETDAPWQSPFKGEKNEPAFVIETIKKIAEIKEISEEEVAKQVWENYEEVFTS